MQQNLNKLIDIETISKELKNQKVNELAGKVIDKLEYYNKTHLSNEYKQAINILCDDLLFYNKTDKILAVPMVTGGGKSLVTELSMVHMYQDEMLMPYCGTIILKLTIDDCDKTAYNINKLANKQIAYSYHGYGGVKKQRTNIIELNDLEQYPILVMTHEGYKQLFIERKNNKNKKIKNLSEFLVWTDAKVNQKTVQYNQFERTRLIIDEEICNIEPIQIGMNTILKLENCIMNLGNHKLYNQFIDFVNNIKKEFLKSYTEKANKLNFVYFNNIEIPDDLDVAIFNSKDAIAKEAFLNILNLLQHGGYVRYSDNVDLKTITTYKYIDIYSKRFRKIQLDATAKVNALYQYNPNYIIQELPEFKTYTNTYIHMYDKITGSRMSINEHVEKGLLKSFINHIKENLLENEKCLIVFNNKEIESIFYDEIKNEPIFLDNNISITHFGRTTGSNEWCELDKIFIIGINLMNDAVYPILYHCHSNENDFNKYDTTLIPTKGARQYAEERFENIRRSIVASSLIQAMNRIKVRKFKDGDTPETHIYLINSDKQIDYILKEGMKGVNILYDWNINYYVEPKQRKNSSENNVEKVIQYIKEIIENPNGEIANDLKNKNILNQKGINKKGFREYLEIKSRTTFNNFMKHPLFKQFCNDYSIKDNNKSQYISII